jgi:hypothetical protein
MLTELPSSSGLPNSLDLGLLPRLCKMSVRLHNTHTPNARRMIAIIPRTIPATRPAGVLLPLVKGVVDPEGAEVDVLSVLAGCDVDVALPKLVEAAAPMGTWAALSLYAARASGEELIEPTMPSWQCSACEQ